MSILDESVPEDARELLRSWRIVIRRIGREVGRKGIKDSEIIPLLHQLDRPTLLTLDGDFYHPRWRHAGYCLVHLDVDDNQVADYIRKVLRHPALNTKAKRMAAVIRVTPTGLSFWRVHQEQEGHVSWR